MTSLQTQIEVVENEIRHLLEGKGELTKKEELLIKSLEAKAAGLRDLRLAEAKRGGAAGNSNHIVMSVYACPLFCICLSSPDLFDLLYIFIYTYFFVN